MSSDMNKTTVSVDNGSFSKMVEMPLLVATELKHRLVSIGAKIVQSNVYTNGPRTIFKIEVSLAKDIDVYAKDVWTIKIYGEFLSGDVSGDINVEYAHKVEFTHSRGGFMHDAVDEFYKENVMPSVIDAVSKERISDIIGDVDDFKNKSYTEIKKE